MGKPKHAKTATSNNVNKHANPCDEYMSTKSEMVRAKSDISMKLIYPMAIEGVVVIAEDSRGFYCTGNTYVDSPMMDPYRQYHRNLVSIVKTETGFDIETKDGNFYSVLS